MIYTTTHHPGLEQHPLNLRCQPVKNTAFLGIYRFPNDGLTPDVTLPTCRSSGFNMKLLESRAAASCTTCQGRGDASWQTEIATLSPSEVYNSLGFMVDISEQILYVYVYICIYMVCICIWYIYIYVYVYVHVYVYVNVYIYMHMYM